MENGVATSCSLDAHFPLQDAHFELFHQDTRLLMPAVVSHLALMYKLCHQLSLTALFIWLSDVITCMLCVGVCPLNLACRQHHFV